MARSSREFDLQCAVVQHLRLAAPPEVYWFHPANGEWRSPRTAGRLKAMGVRPGVPDFVLIIGGIAHGLELKADTGRLSQSQILAKREWEAAGGRYEVAKGIDAALAVLRSWGALRASYGLSSISMARAA